VLLDSIGLTLSSIKNYVILLILFIYIYALLGMQFFSGRMKFNDDGDVDQENGDSPRLNFDELPQAALTIFCILIGDGWNDIMYNGMRGQGKASAAYFILLVILGNVIMLNLFLAILLGNFDHSRKFIKKKKVFEEFKKYKEQKVPLSKSM